MTSNLISRSAAYAVHAIASIVFVIAYFSSAQEASLMRFPALMSGEVAAPFSYRLLVPFLMSGLYEVLPLSRHRLAQVLIGLALWGTLWIFGKLLARDYGHLGHWLSLLLLWPMTFNYVIYGDFLTPWDLPSMFFFVLGMWVIVSERYHWLVPLVVVATLNRETALMIPLAYAALTYGKVPRGKWLNMSSGLLVLWAITKVMTVVIAPGVGNSAQVFHNHLYNLPYLAAVFTSFDRAIWLATIFGGLHLLFLVAVWSAPTNLKRLALLVPFLCGIFFFTSGIHEERIYNEIVPIITLVCIHVFIRKPVGSGVRSAEGIDRAIDTPLRAGLNMQRLS